MSEINEPVRELDLGQAVVFLEKAIAEKGADYVYEPAQNGERCLYFDNGTPSCLVGHVLSYMGYDSTDVTENEDAETTIQKMGIEFDKETARLLCAVQENQDDGLAWGESLRRARFGGVVE